MRWHIIKKLHFYSWGAILCYVYYMHYFIHFPKNYYEKVISFKKWRTSFQKGSIRFISAGRGEGPGEVASSTCLLSTCSVPGSLLGVAHMTGHFLKERKSRVLPTNQWGNLGSQKSAPLPKVSSFSAAGPDLKPGKLTPDGHSLLHTLVPWVEASSFHLSHSFHWKPCWDTGGVRL